MADGNPRLAICKARPTVMLTTDSWPRPRAPSHRATTMLEPTPPATMKRRVAKVQPTCEAKRREETTGDTRGAVSRSRAGESSSLLIRSRVLLNPSVIPNAQVQQGPQMRTPVALLPDMLRRHALNESVVKEVSLANR